MQKYDPKKRYKITSKELTGNSLCWRAKLNRNDFTEHLSVT